MIETFEDVRFRPATLALIEHANRIIDEYQALGFTLTLRQLFYQFVSRPALGLENSVGDYKRLGRTVTDARRGGLIDWGAIEDRTRNVRSLPTWDDPSSIVSACANQYREDVWTSQTYRPEVWVEKDALTGVIAVVSEEFRVPWFSCRGNVSELRDVRRRQTLRTDSRPRPSSARPAPRRSRSQRPRYDPRRSGSADDVRA